MGILRARVGGQWVDIGVATGPPIGSVITYAGATAPDGYLACNGTAVSRATYAALFAAIGTAWGVGDGSTTFNLPDLMGRVPVGAGAGAGLTVRTLAAKIGAESVTLSAAESGVPAHAHTQVAHGHSAPGAVGFMTAGPPSVWTTFGGTGVNVGYSATDSVTPVINNNTAAAASAAHANMQPSAVVTFLIRAS